jgi:hypothetical protein
LTLRLNGSTSGYVEIDAPATAGSNTIVLPTGNGSNGQYLQTNGSGALSWSTSGLPAQVLTLGTAVASTSGTSIDFTSIPSTVKRITVIFNGVSTNGGSALLVRIGDSGGIETTSYISTNGYTGTATGQSSSTSGFLWMQNNADTIGTGHALLTNISGNTWIFSSVVGRTNDNYIMLGGGTKTLSDTLDRVRLTATNGTDTFDAGSINILYEG